MKNQALNFATYHWSDLSTDLLYDLMRIRQEVFIVEQECPYLDADGKDQKGYHVTMEFQNQLVGYTRLLPLIVSYPDYTSIGRVVIGKSARGKGWGYPLMQYSIDQCKALWPNDKIKISAQAHLKGYYEQCGFEWTGEEYLEDDIPHIGMIESK